MKESCIDVVSRSAMTADATPVVLSSTERFRFRFMPMLRSVYKELHADHETGAADNK